MAANDDEEKAWLEGVADEFGRVLARYGLSPTPVRPQAGDTGWYSYVANWSKGRPSLSVWFDRFLDASGPSHFWFGFQGVKEHVEKLIDELPSTFLRPAEYNYKSFKGKPENVTNNSFVRDHGGWVYERYRSEDHYFGIYDVGLKSKNQRLLLAEAAALLAEIVDHVQPMNAFARDMAELEKQRKAANLDDTEYQTLVLARKGQGLFRRQLELYWGGGCAITTCTTNEILRASHIKPWRDCKTTDERLDKDNGLLLTANLDALFDRGLISFDNKGNILVSSRLPQSQAILLNLKDLKLLKAPTPGQRTYLAAHRNAWAFA